jgi:hypothetical protein
MAADVAKAPVETAAVLAMVPVAMAMVAPANVVLVVPAPVAMAAAAGAPVAMANGGIDASGDGGRRSRHLLRRRQRHPWRLRWRRPWMRQTNQVPKLKTGTSSFDGNKTDEKSLEFIFRQKITLSHRSSCLPLNSISLWEKTAAEISAIV